MDHEYVLNKILANTCPKMINGDYRTFELDLHCCKAVIEAEFVMGDLVTGFNYNIRKIELRHDGEDEEEKEDDVGDWKRTPDKKDEETEEQDTNVQWRQSSDANEVPSDWVDESAESNGIGPVCKYCNRLIDAHPNDHAVGCIAKIGEDIERPFNKQQNPSLDAVLGVVSPPPFLIESTSTTTKENKNVSYYGSSDLSQIIDTLRDKASNALSTKEELDEAYNEIEDKMDELQQYIDEVENLISNLDNLPEVDVYFSLDVSFDSNS